MPDNDRKALGRRFKELRRKAGYSQERMAELVGVESNSISRIECGVYYPALETLERAAKALGVELRDFFLFSEGETIAEMRAYLSNIAQEADAENLREIYLLLRNHATRK